MSSFAFHLPHRYLLFQLNLEFGFVHHAIYLLFSITNQFALVAIVLRQAIQRDVYRGTCLEYAVLFF